MFKKVKTYFVISAVVTFFITGLAKVLSALGSAEVLTMPDPVLHISFSKLFFFCGSLEITVAVLCVFYRSGSLPIALLAWMSTTLGAYRMGLVLKNWHEPCRCLGSMTAVIHISPHLADNILKAVLTYLLLASYAILLLELFQFPVSKKMNNTRNITHPGFVEGGQK